MRPHVATLALVLTACGASPPPERGAPKPVVDPDRYISDDGHFSAIFPGKPDVSEKQVETEVGTFTIHNVGVAVLTPGELGAFSVSYTDVPKQLNMLETMRTTVRTAPRVLLREQSVDILDGTVHGYELAYEDGDLEKTGRFFQIGPRYFQVLVEYPKGNKPPGMRKFIESFELR